MKFGNLLFFSLVGGLMLMSAFAQTPASRKDAFCVVHRGDGKVGLKENSLAACLKTWNRGWIPELDPAWTKDGVLFAFHDAILRGRPIGEYTAAELDALGVERFEPIFKAMREDPTRRIAFDYQRIPPERLVGLIRDYGIARQFFFSTGDPAAIARWRKLLSETKTHLWIWTGTWSPVDIKDPKEVEKANVNLEKFLKQVEACPRGTFDVVQVHVRVDYAKGADPFAPSSDRLSNAVQRLKAKGAVVQMMPWTQGDVPRVYPDLAKLGAESFGTDYPDVVEQQLSKIPSLVGTVDAGTSFAQNALERFVDSGEIAGAISVFYDGGVQETACLGFADAAAGRRISLDDVFMQCSQTKGFCGTTVAILVEEGKLSLDDPVAKYLPEFKELWIESSLTNGEKRLVRAKNVLTVRNVMNHTGGFPFELPNTRTMGGWSRRMPLRSVAATAAAQPIAFEPGTKAKYSNVGIDIGAAIVEVVSGQRWETFLQKRVLDPLEMKDTGFWPTDAQLKNRIRLYDVAAGARARLRSVEEWMQPPYNDDRVFASAGAGLWTTARDQLKFYKMLMNLGIGDNGYRILKPETVRSLLARSTRAAGQGGYSMGLDAPENDADDSWFGHGGAWNTSCMVNWHRRQLKLWVVQFDGPEKWIMCRKERNGAADLFFKTKIDSSGVDAHTGRLD